MDKSAKDIFKLIKKYDIITIHGHVNPDCDCYGSSLGLREILRTNFKNKQIYSLGYGQDNLHPILGDYDVVDDEIVKQSLAIIVDCSETPRIMDQRISTAKQIVKIDHHIESTPFVGYKWVDVESIACAQMIVEFAQKFHLKINQRAANLLYLGICTDSGRFRYAPTNAKTHRIVADLYDIGINPKSLFSVLYLSDANYVKYQSLLVSRFKMTKNHVIYCFADVPDYEQFGLKYEQVSKNVNVIGNIIGCPVWVLFTRSPEGVIRVEFRSTGLNVQQVAVKYGGGGHQCAAGARLDNQKDFSLAMEVVNDLDKLVEESLNNAL